MTLIAHFADSKKLRRRVATIIRDWIDRRLKTDDFREEIAGIVAQAGQELASQARDARLHLASNDVAIMSKLMELETRMANIERNLDALRESLAKPQ